MDFKVTGTSAVVGEAIGLIIDEFRQSPTAKTEGSRIFRIIDASGDGLVSSVAQQLNGYDEQPGRNLGVVSIALNMLLTKHVITERTGYYRFDEATTVTFVLEAHQLTSTS